MPSLAQCEFDPIPQRGELGVIGADGRLAPLVLEDRSDAIHRVPQEEERQDRPIKWGIQGQPQMMAAHRPDRRVLSQKFDQINGVQRRRGRPSVKLGEITRKIPPQDPIQRRTAVLEYVKMHQDRAVGHWIHG
jgi:hypothetical protein